MNLREACARSRHGRRLLPLRALVALVTFALVVSPAAPIQGQSATPTPTATSTATATPAPRSAAFVRQTHPETMAVGERATVSVTMRNTGSETWTPGGGYFLGTVDSATTWLPTARVALPAGSRVERGHEVTFAFEVVAPTTPGEYPFHWRMFRDGGPWFGDTTPYPGTPVRVLTAAIPTPTPTATPTIRFADIHMEIDQPVAGTLPPREPVPARITLRIEQDGTILGVREDPLSAVSDKMWSPGQTLRIHMTGGTEFVRSKVRQYAVEWTKYANIGFEFVGDSEPTVIKISFDPGPSWSKIGRDALLVPFNFSTMNFGWFDDNTSEILFRRTVIHEFGHALGLIHEHQSPVSGIQWDREKVYQYFKEEKGWDRNRVDEQVLDKYNASSTNYSQYDPTSVMIYAIPAELTLDGRGVEWNTYISEMDQKFVRQWYPFPPTPQNATGQLRTEDCDQIQFSVEYGVISPNTVKVRLFPGATITWWKSVRVPIVGGAYSEIEIQDRSNNEREFEVTQLDTTRPLRFSKAKLFGVHTGLNYSWPVLPALPGGSQLTLTWVDDECR